MKIGKIASHTIIISEQKRQKQNNKEDKKQKEKQKEQKEKLIPEHSINSDLGSNFDASV